MTKSFATEVSSTADSRVALYVYPGDFERRGMVRSGSTYVGVALSDEMIVTFPIPSMRSVMP